VAIRRIEDGANVFCHFTAHILPGYMGVGILLQVELAALSGYLSEDGYVSAFQ
jgi:hypothetical protein